MNTRDQELYEQMIKHAAGEWLDEMAQDCPSDEELKSRYTFSAAFEAFAAPLVRREDKRTRRQETLRRVKRMGIRAGVAACIVIAVLSLAAFTIPPLRIAITNLLVEQKDGYYDINLEIDNGGSAQAFNIDAVLSYVPDGFAAVNVHESDISLYIVLENENHQTIRFERQIGGSGMTLDSDDADFTPVEINGLSGYISLKHDKNTLILNNEQFSFVLESAIDKEILIKMAQNIKY